MYCGIELADVSNLTLPEKDPEKEKKTLHAYSALFPVFKDESQVELNKLKSLGDLESAASLPDPAGIDMMGNLLGYLMNEGVYTEDLDKAALSWMMGDISKRLDFEDGDVDKMMDMLAYFSVPVPHLNRQSLFKGDNAKLMKGCVLNSTSEFATICSQPGDHLCSQYCGLVVKGREAEEVMMELFEMSLPVANRPGEAVPGSLLPGCSWDQDGNSCWERITTDRGVCFTSYNKGKCRRSICEQYFQHNYPPLQIILRS